MAIKNHFRHWTEVIKKADPAGKQAFFIRAD